MIRDALLKASAGFLTISSSPSAIPSGGVYGTWESVVTGPNMAFSDGDLTATKITTNAYNVVWGNIYKSTGKYYYEATIADGGATLAVLVGFSSAIQDYPDNVGGTTESISWSNSGRIYYNGSYDDIGETYNDGDTIGVAVDLDSNTMWLRRPDGSWTDGNPATGTGGYALQVSTRPLTFAASPYYIGNAVTINLGASGFSNVIPAGFGYWTREETTFIAAEWNPLEAHPNFTFSLDNRMATKNATSWVSARGSIYKNSGKHYFELYLMEATYGNIGIGNSSMTLANYVGVDTNGWGYQRYQNRTYHDGYNTVTDLGVRVLDVVMCAVDLDSGKIWWGLEGTWLDGEPSTGLGEQYSFTPESVTPAISLYGNTTRGYLNCGQQDFMFTVPSGFNAGWYTEV